MAQGYLFPNSQDLLSPAALSSTSSQSSHWPPSLNLHTLHHPQLSSLSHLSRWFPQGGSNDHLNFLWRDKLLTTSWPSLKLVLFYLRWPETSKSMSPFSSQLCLIYLMLLLSKKDIYLAFPFIRYCVLYRFILTLKSIHNTYTLMSTSYGDPLGVISGFRISLE